MNSQAPGVTAITAPNQFADAGDRKLAYRCIGEGKPIVLCTRFRGNMDVWDPLFLDSLAREGLRVITFDYTGLGLSGGDKVFDIASMAKDANDLATALGLEDAVIAGWSLGGMAAQVALTQYPARFSHAVLIGTNPPMSSAKPSEQLFYDTAGIPEYGMREEEILFFEPASPASRAAAERSVARIAQRKAERSKPWPLAWAVQHLGTGPQPVIFPASAILAALKTNRKPILHIGGDHDIICPVENWYAVCAEIPNLQLLTYSQSGHGPQHQFPEASAAAIAAFLRTSR